MLSVLVAQGQRRGEVSDAAPAEQVAELFIAIMLVTIRNWLIGKETEPLDKRLLRAWWILRDGAMRPTSIAVACAAEPEAARSVRSGRTRKARSTR